MSDGLRRCLACNSLLDLDAHGRKRYCTNACRQRAAYAADPESRRAYQREWQARQTKELENSGVADLRWEHGLTSRGGPVTARAPTLSET